MDKETKRHMESIVEGKIPFGFKLKENDKGRI
jgi:hypothetical protein